jgi:hypothetical protein
MDKLLAAIVLLACVLLLLRMAVGERRRRRLDAGARRAGRAARRAALIAKLVALRLWHTLRYRRSAANEAEAAIRRARGRQHEADGNVIRPESFKPDNKPRKPH